MVRGRRIQECVFFWMHFFGTASVDCQHASQVESAPTSSAVEMEVRKCSLFVFDFNNVLCNFDFLGEENGIDAMRLMRWIYIHRMACTEFRKWPHWTCADSLSSPCVGLHAQNIIYLFEVRASDLLKKPVILLLRKMRKLRKRPIFTILSTCNRNQDLFSACTSLRLKRQIEIVLASLKFTPWVGLCL